MSADAGEDLLMEFSGRLAGQTGLFFPKERFSDLKRGISSAARQLGSVDPESYLKQLIAEPLTNDRIKMLTPHLTVGETYFFRDKICFDFLEEVVLPALIRSRQESRIIRIWSAGCSSGEEPYSVAMLLERLLQDIDDWTIYILATDINPSVLTRARDGIYGAWSFREVPDSVRTSNFSRTGEKKWKIHERTKRLVTFSYHNLMEDPFPSTINGTNAMDLILCRNVLMYLSEQSTKKITSQFSPSLTDGGWLVFSPAETSLGKDTGLAPVHFHGQTFFRKEGTMNRFPVPEVQAPAEIPSFAPSLNPFAEFPDINDISSLQWEKTGTSLPGISLSEMDPTRLIETGLCAEAAVLLEDRIRKGPASNSDIELLVRAYANLGNFHRALQWCERGIASDRLNPTLHYLHAIILEEQGDIPAGLDALRRTLYLDPDFILGHIALGSSARKKGRGTEAIRHFANARNLLQKMPDEDTVPESGGLTARHLQEILANTGSAGL